MKDRNVIHLDHLDVQNDHVTGYQYDETRAALFREHTIHQELLHLHDPFQRQLFVAQSLLAIPFRILQHYQLERSLDVVIQNQP